jgi:hypothetical protein
VEFNGFLIPEDCAAKTANRAAASRPTADAAFGQYRHLFLVQHLKFGQVAAAVQAIPAATAARSQSEALAATMLLELWQYVQAGSILFVQEEHGLVIGRIPVMPAWAVDHM